MSRNLSYLQDVVGGISTYLSITAGVINAYTYFTEGLDDKWMHVWLTELLWSGIIESAAITLVLFTDSDLLRAIGSFSMLGVNATSLVLINLAEQDEESMSYIPTFALHGIALGQAIGTFISTWIVDGSDGSFKGFDYRNA